MATAHKPIRYCEYSGPPFEGSDQRSLHGRLIDADLRAT